MLTAAQINSINDVEVRKVEVSEWGGEVFVRTINCNEHKALMAQLHGDEKDDHGHMLLLLTMALCNGDGVCLYDWKNPEHAKVLAERRVSALETCYQAAASLNRLMDEEDELVGKSEAGQTNGSVSG